MSLLRRLESLQASLSQFQSNLRQALSRKRNEITQEHQRRIDQTRQRHQQDLDRLNEQQRAFEADLANQLAQLQQQQYEARLKARMTRVRTHMTRRMGELKRSLANTNNIIRELDVTINEFQSNLVREEKDLIKVQRDIDELNAQLRQEIEQRDRFEMDMDEQTAKLVLVGNTGDGKSTLGNRLLGDESRRGNKTRFHTSSSARSCTSTIECGFIKKGSIAYTVVDTPGLGDTNGYDRIHANTLVKYLYGIENVQSFVLVRNGTNCRLTESDVRALWDLTHMLGSDWWSHVIVVMTHIDDEDDEEDALASKQLFLERLGNTFGLDEAVWSKIPFLCIGKRSFRACVEDIFGVIGKFEPFVCERLQAPVETLRRKLDGMCETKNVMAVRKETWNLRTQHARDERALLESQRVEMRDMLNVPHCYCRARLGRMNATEAYPQSVTLSAGQSFGGISVSSGSVTITSSAASRVICDNCERDAVGVVYHCGAGKTEMHPAGYDLCEQCATTLYSGGF